MLKLRHLLLLLLISSGLGLKAQQNRYVVFFSDKTSTPYTVDAPAEFLSARAIARRIDQNIAITSADLPVDPAYIEGVEAVGGTVFFTTKWLNGAMIEAEPAVISSMEGLSYVDSVVFVAPGHKLTSSGRKMGVDSEQETEEASDVQLRMLGLDLLHQEGFFGDDIYIAFFDGGFTGVNTVDAFQPLYTENRLHLALNLVENNDNVYQYSTHGTRVLSTTAGFIPDTFTGAAYGAEFMLFVTEDATSEYRIEEYNWLIAAEKADSAGVNIISSSVGYFDFDDASMNYTYDDMDGKTTIISQAAAFAAARGILVVASAGNEGNKSWKYITAPADVESILAVGSVDGDGNISAFSSIGPTSDGRIKPDVVAMGSGTAVVNDFGTVVAGSGTSFAAPLITGLAAVLWQVYPELTNIELMDLIKNMGSNALSPDNQYGHGIPSYRVVISGTDSPEEANFSVYPNPLSSDLLHINVKNTTEGIYGSLYNLKGTLLQSYDLGYPSSEGSVSVSLGELRAGVYVLMLNSGSQMQKFRIIIY